MALVACLAVVIFVGPSIPVGEGHRDFIFNVATASASILGLLLVVGLWRVSGTPARTALGLVAVLFVIATLVAFDFML